MQQFQFNKQFIINNTTQYDGIIYTPFMEEVPRAFINIDRHGITHGMGAYWETIANFAEHHKLKVNISKFENISPLEVFEGIQNDIYNLSLNGGVLNQTNKAVTYTYPLEWVRKCIMVPLEPELPKYWYVLWPYDRWIYTASFISAVLIAILMRYFDLPKRVAKHSIVRNLLHSVAIFLYSSNMNISMPNAPLRVQLFYGWLMVIGFILSAYYMPYLTSYNMKPIFLTPIDTMEQLLKSKLRIAVPLNELSELQAISTDYEKRVLKSLLLGFTHSEFQSLLKGFNRSFAYIVSQDQWNFLNRQQRYLIQPYFHISQICFGSIFTAFPLQLNSTLTVTLNDFILRVQENGL